MRFFIPKNLFQTIQNSRSHTVLSIVRNNPEGQVLDGLGGVAHGDRNASRLEHGQVVVAVPPVAYTHLDVYKRQPVSRFHRSRLGSGT